jgi:hypothetical protein
MFEHNGSSKEHFLLKKPAELKKIKKNAKKRIKNEENM